MVFVHGAMDRADSFEPVAGRLTDQDVVTYDRRGYGSSPRLLAPTDLARHVGDLVEVLARRPSVLIGHSFGGLVALGAAIETPELVGAVGVYEPPMPWLDGWPTPQLPPDPGDAAETFFRSLVGDEVWAGLSQGFRQARRAEGVALLSDLASVAEQPPFDLTDVLSPVAAAHGSASAERFRRAARELCAAVGGDELTVIEGAGHGGHMSHPDEFTAWVRTVVGLTAVE